MAKVTRREYQARAEVAEQEVRGILGPAAVEVGCTRYVAGEFHMVIWVRGALAAAEEIGLLEWAEVNLHQPRFTIEDDAETFGFACTFISIYGRPMG